MLPLLSHRALGHEECPLLTSRRLVNVQNWSEFPTSLIRSARHECVVTFRDTSGFKSSHAVFTSLERLRHGHHFFPVRVIDHPRHAGRRNTVTERRRRQHNAQLRFFRPARVGNVKGISTVQNHAILGLVPAGEVREFVVLRQRL